MATRLLTGGECPQGVLDVIEGSIGYLALSNGFASIEYAALRILSNIFLSFTEDVGAASLSLAESTGRTTILLSDVVVALIDMGFDVRRLNDFPRRRQYRGFKEPTAVGESNNVGVACAAVIGPTGATIIPRPLSLKSEGVNTTRGMVISSSQHLGGPNSLADNPVPPTPPAPRHLFVPAVLEPHTYVQTLTTRPPITSDPASFRRRTAEQRRKVQKSLIHFLARIQPMQYLFPGDADSFVLLSPKKSDRPYLDALLADCPADSQSADADEQVHSVGGSKSKPVPSSASLSLVGKASASGPLPNPYLLKPKFPDYSS